MKYLKQVLLIFLFSFLGEMCRMLIPAPIPASIYGMGLLFAALSARIIRVEDVKTTGTFLTTSLSVLFVPPLVSLLDCWDQIRDHMIGLFCIVILSTVLSFAVSGRVTQWLIRRKEDSHG